VRRVERRIPLNHRQGLQCVVTGFRDLLEHGTGLALSEDYCHGLGSGLFFGYMEREDFAAFGSATDNLLENAAANLSAKLVICESTGDDWPELKGLIDAGQPVMVETSFDLIARYSATYGMAISGRTQVEAQAEAEETLGLQLGRHYVVVTGYDDERDLVFCVDNKTSLEIPRDEFMQMRTAAGPDRLFYADRNRIVYFLFPPVIDDLPYRTVLAVRRAVDYWYRYPEHPRALADWHTRQRLGVGGLYNTAAAVRRFREHFPTIGLHHDEAYRRKSLFFCTQVVARSSGPDMLRGMYARFLREAAGVTGLPLLEDAARDYAALAREWRAFFHYLNANQSRLAETWGDAAVVAELRTWVNRLADREEAAVERLAGLTLKW